MTYTTEFKDALLRVSQTWFRASRVESIKSEPSNATGQRTVFVKMFSGEVHRFTMKPEAIEELAKGVMGQ